MTWLCQPLYHNDCTLYWQLCSSVVSSVGSSHASSMPGSCKMSVASSGPVSLSTYRPGYHDVFVLDITLLYHQAIVASRSSLLTAYLNRDGVSPGRITARRQILIFNLFRCRRSAGGTPASNRDASRKQYGTFE